MVKTDALRVAEIQVSSWRKAYQNIIADDYLFSLDISKKAQGWKNGIDVNPDLVRLVILLKNEILGFTVGFENLNTIQTAQAEIASFYIDPDFWDKKLGKKLFEELVIQFKNRRWHSFFLWVLEENHRARSFYEKQGGILTPQKKVISLGGINYPLVSYLFRK